MLNRFSLSFRIIIAFVVALIIVIALVALARYFIVREKRSEAPKPPAQSVSNIISEEILRSLTPPNPPAGGATTTPISKEKLDSLTPPKDAKPVKIPQSVLDSLVPPAR